MRRSGSSAVRRCVASLAVALCAVLLAACGRDAVLSGFDVSPSTISPNGHSTNGTADVRYTVGQRADVTISLIAPDGKAYVLRDKSTRPPGSYVLQFPGAVDGRVLPDGEYQLELAASVPGTDTPIQQVKKALTIREGDSTPPAITEVGAFPNPFHPNGNLATDVTVIHYTLSKAATTSMYAVGKQLGKRYDIVFNHPDTPGPQQATWKGLVGTTNAVPDDDYVIHIRASDSAGNVSEQQTMVSVRDSGIPEGRIIGVRFSEETRGMDKLLKVEVQIENTGTAVLYSWGPDPGYIYPSFHGSYLSRLPDGPDLPEQMTGRAGKYSVAVDLAKQPQDPPPYPWRWGFGKDLRPKEVVTVVGYVRLDPNQVGELRPYAALIHEGQGILSGQEHVGQQVVPIR